MTHAKRNHKMKITKQRLVQIIKEELEAVLNEDNSGFFQGTVFTLFAGMLISAGVDRLQADDKAEELANKISQMSAEQINNLPNMQVAFKGYKGATMKNKRNIPGEAQGRTRDFYMKKFKDADVRFSYDQESQMFSLELKDLLRLGMEQPKELQSILDASTSITTTRIDLNNLEKQLKLIDSDTSLYTSQPSVPSPGAPIKPVDFK